MNATAASITLPDRLTRHRRLDLGASLIIAASIASFARPLAAPVTAPPASEGSEVGRFQSIRHGNYLVLTDTKTGRNWTRFLAAEASTGWTSWQEESVR
jgi:hypothetical protein